MSFGEVYDSVAMMILYIAMGIGLQRLGLMDDELVQKLSRLCFRVFMPITVLGSMWSSSFKYVGPLLLVFEGVFVCIIIAAAHLILRSKEPLQRSVYIQSIFRGNIQTLTLAIMPAIPTQFRAAALLNALLAAACFNIPSVLLFRKGEKLADVLIKVFMTPVIISAAAGILFSALRLPQPMVIGCFSKTVGALIVPLSFICTGASLRFSSIQQHIRPIVLCCAARLMLVPLTGFCSAALLGFRGVDLVLLFPFLVSPCGSACHTIACDAGADSSLSASLVAISQLFAPLTILIWVRLLQVFAVF